MRAKKQSVSYSKYGYWFIIAAVALYTVFMIYPVINSVWLSLHATRGLNSKFVGLGNFKRLLSDPLFWQSMMNNFIFLIVQVPLMTILGLCGNAQLKKTEIQKFFPVGVVFAMCDLAGGVFCFVQNDVSGRWNY